MSFVLALVAAVGALRSRRTTPARVTAEGGSASRKAQAKLTAEARLSANLCFLAGTLDYKAFPLGGIH